MFEPLYFLKIMPNFCQLVNLSNYEIKQIFGHQTWNSTTQLTPLLYILIGTDVHKVVLLKSHVYYFRWILDICKHERVLQAAKKILGPNIVLLSTCLITKYPNVDEKRVNFNGDFVGWHQDLEYCGLVNVEPNEGPKLITMWLAIDKVRRYLQ
mgnify:CR=1 FL=1